MVKFLQMFIKCTNVALAHNVSQICVRCVSDLALENGANVLLALVALRWIRNNLKTKT